MAAFALRCAPSEGWRRGELNPCPRRYPRKHLHVYPTISSEEPSHAPAHCQLPSVHKIDSRTGVVAPPIRQPAVHVCRRSRRPTANVTVNSAEGTFGGSREVDTGLAILAALPAVDAPKLQ